MLCVVNQDDLRLFFVVVVFLLSDVVHESLVCSGQLNSLLFFSSSDYDFSNEIHLFTLTMTKGLKMVQMFTDAPEKHDALRAWE